MGMRRIDQIWLAAGLAFIVLLVAGGWFLFISPKFGEADDVNAEAATAQPVEPSVVVTSSGEFVLLYNSMNSSLASGLVSGASGEAVRT